jgi:hypothetical protein
MIIAHFLLKFVNFYMWTFWLSDLPADDIKNLRRQTNMILNLQSILEMKNTLNAEFGVYLHVRDTCGGQSFWFETLPSDQAIDYVCGYVGKLGGKVLLSEDKKQFTVM